MRARYRPSVDFARCPAAMTVSDAGIATRNAGPFLKTDVAFRIDEDLAEATFFSSRESKLDLRTLVPTRRH